MGGGPVASSVQMQTTFAQFNAQGELIRPDPSYREKFVYIGTPLTPNDLNDGRAPFPEFHNVYMDPVTFQHFKETGEIRDGAMVLKELISVGDKKASSGNGYFMGEFIGLEAAVKSTEHFANEPQ
ncbi:cytochrome P460 family protein [Chloroflexi bacterium TSY]|nr:cytochrome P460 family protein [Chloroflexi bacterium TSY]